MPMDPRLTSLTPEKLLAALGDLLMPRGCIVCGRTLIPGERHLCCSCLAELPLTHFERMPRNPMADSFNGRLSEESHTEYLHAAALFSYDRDGGYDRISKDVKYGRNFAAGRWFGAMLGKRLCASGLYSGVDIVCCVPLHWARRFRRGYNQAEIIASAVAGQLPGAVAEPRLLERMRHTRSQAGLGTEEKAANVAGAFAVRRAVAQRHSGARHILVVDDVFTTGATMAECAKALMRTFGPGARISAATLAYADGR